MDLMFIFVCVMILQSFSPHYFVVSPLLACFFFYLLVCIPILGAWTSARTECLVICRLVQVAQVALQPAGRKSVAAAAAGVPVNGLWLARAVMRFR